MSMTIRNGYTIPKVYDSIGGLMAFASIMSRKMRECQRRIMLESATRYLTVEHDMAAAIAAGLFQETTPGSASGLRPCSVPGEAALWSEVWSWFVSRVTAAESGRERDVDFDFECSCAFFRVQDQKEGVLAMLFCEQRAYIDVWEENYAGSSFWWTSQTDAPADIPKQEWDARGNVWKRLFEDGGTPGQKGLLKPLSDPTTSLLLGKDEILAGFAENEVEYGSRVAAVCREMASTKKMRAAMDGFSGSQALPISEIAKIAFDVGKWVRDNDESIKSEYSAQVEAVLPTHIDIHKKLR